MIRVTLALALCAALLHAAPAAAQAPEPAPTLVERAASNVQAACWRADGPCPKPAIAAYESSDTHRALVFQYELADGVPFRDAPWPGTHNSYHSGSESPTLSGLDHNQKLSMLDQLRLDMRSLELDLHYVGGVVRVCHGLGADRMHGGCTRERTLAERLPEIATWLGANPDQVLLVFLEDHLVDRNGHDAAAAAVEEHLGGRIFRPQGEGCRRLPLDLTRAAVRAAGKQVVLVSSGCGVGAAWQGLVHDWGPKEVHRETRPVGFDAGSCGPDFSREVYDSTLIRYYEDSTVVTVTAAQAGQAKADDGLTPETTRAMVRCGVDLFGFDQLLPDDGRLEALIWSWAPHPSKCAIQKAGGQWGPEKCGERHRFACLGASGWFVTRTSGPQAEGSEACATAGGAFTPPRTGHQNKLLSDAAGGSKPWLAYAPPQRARRLSRGSASRRRHARPPSRPRRGSDGRARSGRPR